MRARHLPACRVAAAIAAAAALACGRAPPERLVVGQITLPATVLFLAAVERGDVAAEGVALDVRPYASGRDALRALLAGELDAATVYETPVVTAILRDERPRVLTRLHRANHGTVVVARADRGIRRGEDLRGKRIAMAAGTNAEFFLRLLLEFSGVEAREVTTVDVEPGELTAALVTGRVDAVAAWSPIAQRAARALGANASVLTSDVYEEASLLVTRSDIVGRKRGALTRLVRALARTERALAADPALGLGVLERALPREDPADLRAAYATVMPQLGLDNLLLNVFRAEADWMVAGRGARAALPPPARYLDPSILSQVDPEAVTVEVLR